MDKASNRDLLVRITSGLLRRKGYCGVGLREVLDASGLPKGSLYYHFPGGKCELAEAATTWAAAGVERILNESFDEASSFLEGAALCSRAITASSQTDQGVQGCPLAAIAHAGVSEPALKDAAIKVMQGWMDVLSSHARRLQCPEPESTAALFLMQLQGAWMQSLSHQDTAPLRLFEASIVDRLTRVSTAHDPAR